MIIRQELILAFCFLLLPALAFAQPSSTVVDFENGADGFTGNAFIESSGGNPDGNAHFFLETFGTELRTGTPGETLNPGFVGDYSSANQITIGVDVQVDTINFFGTEVSRNLGVAFIDQDTVGPSGPAGLWFNLGEISAANNSDWSRFELTLDDFSSTSLPPGWIGFGDEDPMTFEPILPDGATFASVLASVDEFRITTFEPGFFYGFTNFDVRLDNLSIEVSNVPEPAVCWILLGGITSLAMRRQKR